MLVSILVEDKTVTVDGLAACLSEFDWSPYRGVHAVQANLDRNRAEIEYTSVDPDGDGPLPAVKPPNELVDAETFAQRFGPVMEAYAAASKSPISPNVPAGAAANKALATLLSRIEALEAENGALKAKVDLHTQSFALINKSLEDGP